jgi:sarcosine oxidase gamma subunit
VLALVAAGRTNRQIGQALFITPKTASIHVSRILAKLGSPVEARRPRSPTASASTSNDPLPSMTPARWWVASDQEGDPSRLLPGPAGGTVRHRGGTVESLATGSTRLGW